jgi:PelA/Pel-15E family pectate lyase
MLLRLTIAAAISLTICLTLPASATAEEPIAREDVKAALKRATSFFRNTLAVHGGYVYHVTADLNERWGEGPASAEQIWVQPPSTPTVGMAYLKAYRATLDSEYLDAARETAMAIVYGQLSTGGWANQIDFAGRKPDQPYSGGRKRRESHSSLDDGQTAAALQFLMELDRQYDFGDETIHEAAMLGLNSLLAAQFANGGFPQVWTGPAEERPVLVATFPTYDWRTEGRIKEYWTHYTLNDNVAGTAAQTLIVANRIYDDPRPMKALRRLGEFLIAAQLPEPQPGWAQQYDKNMQPAWARAFEPPAVASDETQETIETLMLIAAETQDDKFLKPIPSALAYLKRSLLPAGDLARFYELQTNRPLYMNREGKVYTPTYSDRNLPGHYAWKIDSKIERLESRYKAALEGKPRGTQQPKARPDRVREILARLDDQGRWVSTYKGERLIGQPKFAPGTQYIATKVFCENVEELCDYLNATLKP